MDLIRLIALFLLPLIGGVLGFRLIGKGNEHFLSSGLGFSAGFLLGVVFMHLLPEALLASPNGAHLFGFLVVIGYFLQTSIDLITKGIEHGHYHDHGSKASLSISLLLGLALHSLLEGIPLAHPTQVSVSLFDPLFLGVALHKIPAAFVLASVAKNENLKLGWLLVLIYAAMTPLGLLLGTLLQGSVAILGANIFPGLMAVIGGSLLHIGATVLGEGSKSGRQRNLIFAFAGLIAAYFCS